MTWFSRRNAAISDQTKRSMNQLNKKGLLSLAVMIGGLAPASVSAQAPAAFLALKGVGVGTNAGNGTDVQVDGNFAYRTWSNPRDTNHPGGFEIFSVTNPSAPAWVGNYESRGSANAVRVVNGYAYLAEGIRRNGTNDTGVFEIIDVSQPANLIRVGAIDTVGWANAVSVDGHYAYVAESTRWTGSNLVGALEIFDVSMPTNPVRVAIHDTGGSATSVDASGGYAFLADGVTDLEVLDVSNPASPSRAGGYDIDERNLGAEFAAPATYIQRTGNRVYSSGENGFHILDVSNPTNPRRLGGDNDLPVYAFHEANNYVHAAYYSSFHNTFLLSVIDVSDPTNLTWIASSAIPVWPGSLHAVGSNVYLATNELLLYELRPPPVIRSFSRSNGTLVLTWDDAPGFNLQRTASLDDPDWSDVPGSTNARSLSLPLTGGSGYFRLARP